MPAIAPASRAWPALERTELKLEDAARIFPNLAQHRRVIPRQAFPSRERQPSLRGITQGSTTRRAHRENDQTFLRRESIADSMFPPNKQCHSIDEPAAAGSQAQSLFRKKRRITNVAVLGDTKLTCVHLERGERFPPLHLLTPSSQKRDVRIAVHLSVRGSTCDQICQVQLNAMFT